MEQKRKKNDFYSLEYDKIDSALTLLKIEKGLYAADRKLITFENTAVTSVKGYDYMVQIDAYEEKEEKTINGVPLVIERESSDMLLKVKIGENVKGDFDIFLLGMALKKEFKRNREKFKPIEDGGNNYAVAQGAMSITRTFEHYDLTFVASSIGLYENDENDGRRDNWTRFSGCLLIRLK